MASSAFRNETTETYLSNQSEVSSLGGFIFFCYQDTLAEQLRRHLFALPIEYLDRVKAIRPGLPLFLYNCSDMRVHGVFEAVSNGGSNLRNPPRKHISAEQSGGLFDSQYPAQVKMRVRERRPSLGIDRVRSALYPHDRHELQLELSPTEVENLLQLFDCKNRKFRGCKNTARNIDGKSPKYEISNIRFGSHKATMKVFTYPTHVVPSKEIGDKTIFPQERSMQPSNSALSSCSNGVLESPTPRGLKRNETFWRKKVVSSRPATNNSAGMAVLSKGINGSTPREERRVSQAKAISLQSSKHNINGEQLSQPGQQFHEHSDTSNKKAFLKPPKICGDQKYVYVESKIFESGKNVEKPPKHNDNEKIFDREEKQKKQQTQQGTSERDLLSSPMSPLSYVPYVLQTPIMYSNVPVADSLPQFCHSLSYPLEEYNHAPLGTSIHLLAYDMLESNEVNMHALHSEILKFAHNVRPSDAVFEQVQAAVECIRLKVKHCWPNKDVEVFGSFATGLCLSHSDIDLVVVDRSCQTALETTLEKEDIISLIRELAKQLTGCSWCERLFTIESAAIPVIKLRCNSSVVVSSNEGSRLKPIDIDITIEGRNGDKKFHSGLNAREFVLQKLHQFPSLVPLVLLLKSYLHYKGLNTVYFGGLASYSLTLMLVFYFEQTFPVSPDMPLSVVSLKSVASLSLFDKDFSVGEPVIKRAKYVIDQLLRILGTSVGFPNLGALLKGFLYFFGSCVEFSRMRIVLQGNDGNSGGIFWQSESKTPAPLHIEDPLRQGVNVGAGSFNMCHVQTAFLEMLQSLTRPLQDTSNHTNPISSQRSSLPYLDQLFCKT